MKITNKTSFRVVVFGWDLQYGHNPDRRIEPGETVDIPGPFVKGSRGGSVYVDISDEIIVHEKHDSGKAYFVGVGQPLKYGTQKRGFIIRHFMDARPGMYT